MNNPGTGLALRAHPTSSSESQLEGDILYPHGYVVWADMRVVEWPTVYVRVQGSTGWLFTHRGAGADTLLPLDPATAAAAAAIAPSTPPKHDFTVAAVRAAASRQGGMVYIDSAWFQAPGFSA